jgi:hypothetical protein
MADPTTVIDFTQQQNDNLVAALKTAQADLIARQTAYSAAQTALTTLQTQLAGIAADMSSVRTQLAAAVTPEDGSALLLQLQSDITESRQTTGQIAIAQLNVTVAGAEADGATAEVQRLTAALAASNTALTAAKAQATRRAALAAALTAPPLVTIVADAGAVLAGTATVDAAGKFKLTDAANRLKADLPAALIAQAEVRLKDEIARSTANSGEYLQAQTALEGQWTSDGGVSGALAALQNVFNRAGDALNQYVTTANDRFNMAKTAIASVADPTVSPLSAAQSASIQDATTVANAVAGAALEKAVDDQVALLAQKQQTLDDKTRQAIANHVDPSTDAGVQGAQTDVTNAENQLQTLQAAFTAVPAMPAGAQSGEQESVVWEVRVPDSEWQLLWAYENAQLTLNWLTTPGPAALSAALDTAEQNLVKQLLVSDTSTATAAALQADATKRNTIANYETTAADSRRFSALRGDF